MFMIMTQLRTYKMKKRRQQKFAYLHFLSAFQLSFCKRKGEQFDTQCQDNDGNTPGITVKSY